MEKYKKLKWILPGIFIPLLAITISPTYTLSLCISIYFPYLITVTSFFPSAT